VRGNVRIPCSTLSMAPLLAVDATRYSTVVRCTHCGARFAATTREAALELAAEHPARAHGQPAESTRYRAERIRRRRGQD